VSTFPVTGGSPGWSDEVVLPMFPLEAVLFPCGILPLHVFEPRYRRLAAHCLAGDGRFGVVLIERGSEVGGGDCRLDIGTVATIEHSAALPDGRLAMVARGGARLQVARWLADDPYPIGSVRLEPDAGSPRSTESATVSSHDDAHHPALVATAAAALRRAYALRSELGLGPAWPATLQLADDPITASWQLCDLAPLGAADRQHLLEMPTLVDRMHLLDSLVSDLADDLTRLLTSG